MTSICNLCESEITKYNLIKHQKSDSCTKIHNLLVKKNQEYLNKEKPLLDKIKSLEEEVCNLKQENENIKYELAVLKHSDNNNSLQTIPSESFENTINSIDNSSFNLFRDLTGKNLVLNNIEIIYRKSDGYINVSKLCKAGGKLFADYNKNKRTEIFLQTLASSMRILIDSLIKYETGSNNERSTWAHPQIAVNIAQWISPEFDVQVSKWVYELCITGNVSIDSKITTQELDNMLKDKYEYQLQEINRLQVIENKYKYELDILKQRENELIDELDQYKHQNIKSTNNIQMYKDKEKELLIILENTQNKLLSVKEDYDNEINNKPLDKYVNEICDNFRLNEKIEDYYGYNCLYVLYIDTVNNEETSSKINKKQYYFKFGETSNIENRINQHKQKFTNMKIMWIVKSNNANHTERKFKEWLKINNMLSKYENQTEIIKLETEDQLFNIKDQINIINRENNTVNTEILNLKHNIELDNEKINGLQEKIKCLEYQIKLYEHIVNITTK